MYLSVFKALKGFMSKDQTRPALCTINITQDDESIKAVATDGKMCARIVSRIEKKEQPKLPDNEPCPDIPEEGILVDRVSVEDIIKTTPRNAIHPKHAVVIYGPNGNGHAKGLLGIEKVISCRLVEGKAPNTDQIFPEAPRFIFRLDARKLAEVCKMAKTLNKDRPFIRFSMTRSNQAVYFEVKSEYDIKADGLIMPVRTDDSEIFDATAKREAIKVGE